MYIETTYLSYTNSKGQRVTFAGFTEQDFKKRYLAALEKGKREYIEKYTVPHIADLGDSAVQLALIDAFCMARDAAVQADAFFSSELKSKQPNKLHSEIFGELFSTKKPGSSDYRLVQETFEKTSRGLGGSVTICDMFKGADHEPGGPSWGPSEGEVLIPQNILRDYSQRAKKSDAAGDIMRKMLEKEGEHVKDIYIRFNLVRELSVEGLARVILHEATHKFAYTGDYQYIYDATSMKGIKSKQALYNADSYAFAGMSVYLNRVVTKADLVGPAACSKPLHDKSWLRERMQ
ncbi:M35 family metallo-endopeptidase [Methylomonas rivi]|uniref:M35 family metallopeptidase n=1 Tax=Methylomonas rivi TaxID=2952226 RepID=A0ABT1U6B5_9GAMM|nr:M35 family metallo-endopeptidase [Methylomonas sp. WSC-6]MCQ8129404.1 M35 family metallopeptidase [Methylomonas sp. WSC-6]